MTATLANKIALVTGAASGIGLAAAKRFALEGARVVVSVRRQAELDAAVKSIGDDGIGLRVDSSIRVNTISPGATRTPGLVEPAGTDAAAQQGPVDYLAAQILLGRVGEPDEIAKAAVFLASDDASVVNGAELLVDGGQAQI